MTNTYSRFIIADQEVRRVKRKCIRLYAIQEKRHLPHTYVDVRQVTSIHTKGDSIVLIDLLRDVNT